MRLFEALFTAGAVALAAVMVWAAANAPDGFYAALAMFTAAFWGALAGCGVWSRISERRPENGWKPSIIWPNGRRPC